MMENSRCSNWFAKRWLENGTRAPSQVSPAWTATRRGTTRPARVLTSTGFRRPTTLPKRSAARRSRPWGSSRRAAAIGASATIATSSSCLTAAPAFRGRRPENFVDEIEWLIDQSGIRRFRFITESIPPAFARRACRLLLNRGIHLRWHSFAMVDRRFDRDLLALMVEAGCDHLTIGLETMNARVLKLVHKSADREENLRFLRDAREVRDEIEDQSHP